MIDMTDPVSPEEHACQIIQSSASSDRDNCLKTTAGQSWCFP